MPILTTGAGKFLTSGGGGGGTVLHDFSGATALAASGTSATFAGSSSGTTGGFPPSVTGDAPGFFGVGSGPNGTTNRALVVALMFPNEAHATVTSPSCTWNGVALTMIGGPYFTTSNGDFWLFGMVAPATGQNNLAASWTGTARVMICCQSVVGALQTGGSTTFHGATSNTGSSTTASVTLASALANEMSFMAAFSSTNLGAPLSHTEINRDNSSPAVSAILAQHGSAAGIAFTCTAGNSPWVAAAVAIAGA